MSHPFASRTRPTAKTTAKTAPRTAATTNTSPTPQRLSRRAEYKARAQAKNQATNQATNHRAKAQSARTQGIKTQTQKARSDRPFLTPHRQKLLGAGGAITLLAMATILPTQVSSQAIVDSNCEQVIKSGGEISRGQLSSLLVIPLRSTREAVRQAVAEPYCTLPTVTPEESTKIATTTETNPDSAQPKTIEREAYPLAFDPEAWVVINYSEGEYQGYDFVFKP